MKLLLKQIVLALAHLHTNDFIHLDLKPENMLLNPDAGHPHMKLTDFDLCIRCTGSKKVSRNAGTPYYMAPEHLETGLVNKSADVFSFGILAYLLLTQKPAFTGHSIKDVVRHKLSTSYEIKPPMDLKEDIQRNINNVVMTCLKRDPSQRYCDMVQVMNALKIKPLIVKETQRKFDSMLYASLKKIRISTSLEDCEFDFT